MTERLRGRRPLFLAGFLAAVWLTWSAIAAFVVPAIIRQAYAGESFGFLNRVISGQASHSVEDYLGTWSRAGVASSLGLLVLCVGVFLIDLYRRPIKAWIARVLEPVLVPAANQPAWLAMLGLTCGLLGGFVQAIAVAIRTAGLPSGEFYWERMWMAPAVNAIAYGLIGLVLTLLLLPARRWLRAIEIAPLGLIGFAIYDTLRLVVSRLYPWAVALLALGLAIQITRRLVRTRATRPFLLRGAATLMTVVLVIGSGRWALEVGRERLALARLGAPAAGAPNVLLIILDTVRAQNLSVYGYDRNTTPELEALAGNGTVFDLAISSAPWTLPSHASIFTGREASDLSADFVVPLDDTYPTIAEALRANGYRTAGFVANVSYAGRQSGLARGFDHYEDQPFTLLTFLRSARLTYGLFERTMIRTGRRDRLKYKTAEQVAEGFLGWLDGPTDRPFFAFLNFFDAHDPYTPPLSFERRFSDVDDVAWFSGHLKTYSASELEQLEATYDDAIAYIDEELGRLFRTLDDRGILDNTIVIVTADHGEQLGEHAPDLAGHGKSLYLQELHVPLILSYPRQVPRGVRIGTTVGTRQLPSTIMDLAGLGSYDGFSSPSLASTWNPAQSDLEPATSFVGVNPRWQLPESNPASRGPMYSIVVDTLHLIENADSTVELYNVIQDPGELDDLADRPGLQSRLEALQALLVQDTTGNGRARMARHDGR